MEFKKKPGGYSLVILTGAAAHEGGDELVEISKKLRSGGVKFAVIVEGDDMSRSEAADVACNLAYGLCAFYYTLAFGRPLSEAISEVRRVAKSRPALVVGTDARDAWGASKEGLPFEFIRNYTKRVGGENGRKK